MPEIQQSLLSSLLKDTLDGVSSCGSQSVKVICLELSAGTAFASWAELIGTKSPKAHKPKLESLARDLLKEPGLSSRLERLGEVELDLSDRDFGDRELARLRFFYAQSATVTLEFEGESIPFGLHGWAFTSQRAPTPFSPLLLRRKFDQLMGGVTATFRPPSASTFTKAMRAGAVEKGLGILKDLYGLSAVVLWLYDENAHRYRSLSSVGTRNHVFKVPAVRPGPGRKQGLVSQIRPNRKPVVYDAKDPSLWYPPASSTEWEPFDKDLFKAQKWRACIALPIVCAGRVVGALSAYSGASATELLAVEDKLADHAATCGDAIYVRREEDVVADLAARYDEELLTANVSLSALSLSHDVLHYYRSVLNDVNQSRAYLETRQFDRALNGLQEAGETMQRTEPALTAMRKLASEARDPQAEADGRVTADVKSIHGELRKLLLSILPHFSKSKRLPAENVEVTMEGEPRPVLAAPLTLERVVVNLCVNAAQWQASHVWVSWHFDRSEDELQVVVRDDGQGIPSGVREQVFDRFYSGRGGSGLGLYVVKTLIARVGGEVHLQSYHRADGVDQTGTVVTVILPTK
jgi:signal transduction histidine kinase